MVMRFVHSGSTGTAELETPSLVAVVVRGWHNTVRYGLMVLWFAVAVACIVKTGLWYLQSGWLIVLLSSAILTGVAAPEPLVNTLVQQGFQGFTTIRTWLTATPCSLPPDTENGSPTTAGSGLSEKGDSGIRIDQIGKSKSAFPPENEPIPVSTAKKSGHAVLFAALGATSLLLLALSGNPVSEPRTVITAIAAITIFAGSTEVLQMLTTDRGPSFRDLGIDVAGACAGLTLTWIALRRKPQ